MNIVLFAEKMTELAQQDPTSEVLCASDEEGNSFNSVEDFSIELVERNYQGGLLESGELFSREDLIAEGDYEEHEIDSAFKPAVVIWP